MRGGLAIFIGLVVTLAALAYSGYEYVRVQETIVHLTTLPALADPVRRTDPLTQGDQTIGYTRVRSTAEFYEAVTRFGGVAPGAPADAPRTWQERPMLVGEGRARQQQTTQQAVPSSDERPQAPTGDAAGGQ